jgi:hypothetical protein
MHRHTVAAHLEREGVAVRPQRKMSPRLIERAEQLYADGHSLVAIGKQLGVEASTVGKARRSNGPAYNFVLRSPIVGTGHVTNESQAQTRSSPSSPRLE